MSTRYTSQELENKLEEVKRSQVNLQKEYEQTLRKEIQEKYGNFLYYIEVHSPGTSSSGLVNYSEFTAAHGCYSTKEKVNEYLKDDLRTFRSGPRTYYCTPKVQELEQFTISQLKNIDTEPNIFSRYAWD